MSAIPSLNPADEAETGLIAWAERGWFRMRRCAPASGACARSACTKPRRHRGQSARFSRRIAELADSPLALHTDAANRQHYEVPAFFQACLGKRLKYSSCYYPTGNETLDQAEDAMLELYGERAGLADGQQILELGCGWGSLTLWMAERYPPRGSPPCPTRTASASTSWRSARRVGCTTSRCSPATSTSWNCHRAVRPLRLGGDVRARAQLRAPAGAHRTVAEAARCSCTSSPTAR
jgi:hypothetical protein